MDTYRRFPGLDPQLPSAHLPAGWPRQFARRLFVTAYDELGPLAEFRVQQIVGQYDAELGARARFRRVSDLV
jgi:phenylacetic acid degradation operon negative regulatory protein